MDPENVIQHSAMKSISIAEKAIEMLHSMNTPIARGATDKKHNA